MDLIPVASTNLAAIGYDGFDMYVLFASGGLYRYHNVPRFTFESLLYAPSKGRYYTRFVKGRYASQRIR